MKTFYLYCVADVIKFDPMIHKSCVFDNVTLLFCESIQSMNNMRIYSAVQITSLFCFALTVLFHSRKTTHINFLAESYEDLSCLYDKYQSLEMSETASIFTAATLT